jgi:cellulose synthase/poly-beta-1,6-N-acetylglucosamine synthase-like glycosyltransferase
MGTVDERAHFVEPGPEIESALFSGLPPDDVEDLDDIARLDLSIGLLRRSLPERSAATTLTRHQARWFIGVACVFLLALLLFGHNLLIVAVVTPIIILYLSALVLRLALFRRSLNNARTIVIKDEEAMAVPGWRLPVYTVLVPAYREPEVMPRLVSQLKSMEYPRSRLDIKLLLEADDHVTIEAARSAIGDDTEGIEVVLVPPAHPRTKPKALNYGLTLARGQLLTIYDVEDRPDPLQLRRAAIALARLPDDVVCLQAKLLYFNPQQNLITRWFAIEYKMWFSQLLPGLVQSDAPIPLGGTSNHFRRQILADIGAWDPFNVTEDADLGVRLHRLGYRTGVLDSVTYEEANSDFVNWTRQRSRWYKGYLQTWLVHMRRPRELLRDLGWRGFVMFNLFVGGTPLLAILNPVFWIMTVIWFITRSPFLLSLFPMPLYYAGMLCLIAGNFVFVYATMLSAFEDEEPKLVLAAALTPVYWVMMAVAATKAVLQIVISPSYWEKTFHGLDERNVDAPLSDAREPDLPSVAASETP